MDGVKGPVAELVDAPDLKSVVPKGTCWFKSNRGHHCLQLGREDYWSSERERRAERALAREQAQLFL